MVLIKVAPSLLSADFRRLQEEVRRVEAAGADWLHVDVMDGHFVPNLTVGPLVVEALRGSTRLPLDVHLMIENPERYLGEFARAGASFLTVHAEACRHLHRVVHQIKEKGTRAGVAVNPATPPQVLEYLLGDVDLVLVMSVNPGFAGQTFIPAVLPKVRWLKRLAAEKGYGYELEVDGGINRATAADVIRSGASVLVAGSAVFGSGDVAEAITALRQAAVTRPSPGE